MIKSRNTLLMSAAAVALIAGVGLAFAQAPAPDARTSAPAEKSAPAQTPDAAAVPGKMMDRKGARGQSVQDNARTGATPKDTMSKGATSGATSGANTGVSSGANAEPNTQDRSRTGARQERSRGGDNAETRTNSDTRGSERTMDRTGSRESGSRDGRISGRSDNLSDDRRSTIRTIITRQNVRPMTNVDFALSVGTRVPRNAHFNAVPRELVAINPGWRGFRYVLVGDQILVVNPRTHKIVAILDA